MKENGTSFPITFICQDKKLYVQPAEINTLFYWQLLQNLNTHQIIRTSNSNIIKFHKYSPQISKIGEITSIAQLGSNDTTNTLFKIKSSSDTILVFKIFRIFSPNPEVLMLKNLYQAGFRNIPRPLGSLEISYKKTEIPLILLTDYISSQGDGGILFWNNIQQQIKKWHLSNILKINPLAAYCQKLGETVANFHFISMQIDDPLFYPEPITEMDMQRWKIHIKELLQFNLESIKFDFQEEAYLSQLLDSLNSITRTILKSPGWDLLKNSIKMKIHQDLHLAQMLTISQNTSPTFILLDFEGDPLLQMKAKFGKDPFYRDLASISTAFHYITLNALNSYFQNTTPPFSNKDLISLYLRNKTPSEILTSTSKRVSSTHLRTKLASVLKLTSAWKKFCQREFIKTYVQKINELNSSHFLPPDKISYHHSILHIFLIERFLKEFYYEVHYRREKSIIPLLGLLELHQNLQNDKN
ncbi:MAG: hypothetical protein ACTSRL_21095 [Candidatus Helarchaeota archaeon]